MRNPLVMLGFGPLWALILEPRLVPSWARKRFGRKIIATDLALVALLGGLCALFGWRAVLLVQLPAAMLAGAVGIWLFYVQHQFEDVYWERKERVELRRLGAAGQLASAPADGAAVLHRQHRPAPRAPPAARGSRTTTCSAPTTRTRSSTPRRELSLWDAVLALRLKLYDERTGRLVTFAQARRGVPAPPR